MGVETTAIAIYVYEHLGCQTPPFDVFFRISQLKSHFGGKFRNPIFVKKKQYHLNTSGGNTDKKKGRILEPWVILVG